MESEKTIALITGASSGLGKEFVRIIEKDGETDEIWAIARNEERLFELKKEFGEKIKPLSLDLSDFENLKKAESLLKKEKCCFVKYLVNDAGFAKFCSYNDISIEETLNMINLNVSATVALCLICLPFMKRGSRIINVASQAAFFPLPYMNVYASTKAFVKNYTRALNTELKSRGISATAVCPGWIETRFFERASVNAPKAPSNFKGIVKPFAVAQRAMKDALRGKDISVYGAFVKFSGFAAKILPQKTQMKLWLIQQGIKIGRE